MGWEKKGWFVPGLSTDRIEESGAPLPRSFASTPPLYEVQQSVSQFEQFSRLKSGWQAFKKSPKVLRVIVCVCRQGRYSTVVDLGIYVIDAAIRLRRASKKKDVDKKHGVQCCTARKNTSHGRDFSKNTRTYECCSSMEEQ